MCECYLVSGDKCTNKAKPGSKFCGIHKNCKRISVKKPRKSPARKSPGRKSPGRKSPGRKSPVKETLQWYSNRGDGKKYVPSDKNEIKAISNFLDNTNTNQRQTFGSEYIGDFSNLLIMKQIEIHATYTVSRERGDQIVNMGLMSSSRAAQLNRLISTDDITNPKRKY